jgi:hypothetical protein
MSVRKAVAVLGAGILLLANSATPASAQNDTCIDVYNHSMGAYQTYGPQSPQYAEILNYYSARCLAGSSAPPAYAYTPYAIDPGAAIAGGIIGGAALGSALSSRHGHHRGGYHHRDHYRHR